MTTELIEKNKLDISSNEKVTSLSEYKSKISTKHANKEFTSLKNNSVNTTCPHKVSNVSEIIQLFSPEQKKNDIEETIQLHKEISLPQLEANEISEIIQYYENLILSERRIYGEAYKELFTKTTDSFCKKYKRKSITRARRLGFFSVFNLFLSLSIIFIVSE